MADPAEFACGMCDEKYPSREALAQHNVRAHEMDLATSRAKVLEKYPPE